MIIKTSFQRRNTGLDIQKCFYFSCDLRVHRHRRDREPSRITEERLRRLFKKSRKRRKLSGTYLVNNVPKSSTFHRINRSLARQHKYKSYLRFAFKSKHVVCNTFPKRG